MRTLDITEATALMSKYAVDANQEPVILTREGTPIAVVLPVHNADVETVSLSLNPKFLAIIERSRQSHNCEGGYSSEEVRRHFGVEPYQESKSKAKSRKSKANTDMPKTKRRKQNGVKDDGQV